MALTKIEASNVSDDTVGIAQLSATGTAEAGTYLQGNNTWGAIAVGGITHASQWRLTADFTSSALPISSSLDEVDAPAGFGVIGDSMEEDSGIFTFPDTGYWWIRFTASFLATGNHNANWAIINTSTDGYTSNADVAENSLGTWADPHYVSCSVDYIMDVTNTATHQIRFGVTVGSGFTTRGDPNINETSMTFIRLASTS